MSINGVLEDLPLADVLQFIHLGRRTGTLYMWQDEDRRAEIGFYDGRIVTAWAPDQRKLGDILVAEGLIDPGSLETALLYQKTDGQGQSIGRILVERTSVTRDEIYRVIKEQIQETIIELITWQSGRFQFEVDELNPMDDFALTPAELLDNIDINTQMLVLEATRLFDERHRAVAGIPSKRPLKEASALDRKLRRAGLGRTGDEIRRPPSDHARADERPRPMPGLMLEAMRCQVVSKNPYLAEALAEALPEEQARVVAVRLREAGNRLPGETTSPIVVLDLRCDGLDIRDIATLARTRPAAPVVALVASPEEESAAYDAGALAAIATGEAVGVSDCCRNLIRVLSQPQIQGAVGSALRGGFRRFRRVVFDVQSGLLSATMALNLMNVISESVERAILFLIQGEELLAVGAFGFSNAGEPLAKLTRGLRIRPSDPNALHRAIGEPKPQSIDFDQGDLPSALTDLVGRPATGQVVIFPVFGADHTIAVIYTDNGTVEAEIQDIKILELATSQVGVAFENELLRQQLGNVSFDAIPE